MKKFSKILFFLAGLSLAAVSCVPEEEVYSPGEAEEEGCYGVYFPTQDASGSHTYDPEMEKSITVTVARTVTEGDITVPVEITTNVDSVFVVEDIVFADGQAETTFDITFPNIKEGVNSSISLTITDTKYASKYSTGAVSFDISILCVKWEWLLDPQGDTTIVSWTQNFWGEYVDTYIKYYEVDGIRYAQTVSIPDSHWYNGYYTGYGFFGTGKEEGEGYEWSFVWYPNEENSYGGQFINLPTQPAYENTSYNATVYVYDYYGYWIDLRGYTAADIGDFLSFARKYGDPDGSYPCGYYDGNGGFYIYVSYYYMPGLGGWSLYDYDCVGIASGFTRVDYSLEVSSGFAEDGKLPVYFNAGADVSSVKYAAYEGTLTATQIGYKVEELADSASTVGLTYVYDHDADVNGVEVSFDSTGVYTIVALTYGVDTTGAEFYTEEFASATLTYVAADDEVPVVINAGIEATGRYAAQGLSSDTSLEVYIYGSDIVEAKFGVFSLPQMLKSSADCLNAVLESDGLDEDALAEINGTGYVKVVTGLVPGTQYYLIVYANNAYEEKVITATANTTGDPLPVYQDYDESTADIDTLATSEAFFGEYNYYAKSYYDEDPLRVWKSSVTLSDSDTPDDTDSLGVVTDEYIKAVGLWGSQEKDSDFNYAYYYGFDDTYDLDLYKGVAYIGTTKVAFPSTGGSYYFRSFTTTTGGYWFTGYIMFFAPVGDGYLALMASDAYNNYYGPTYGTFNGLGLSAYKDEALTDKLGNVEWYTDCLLVEKSKDDNGIAPASVKKNIAKIQNALKNDTKVKSGSLDARRDAISRVVSSVLSAPQSQGKISNVKAERSIKRVPMQAEKITSSVRQSNRDTAPERLAKQKFVY